MNYDQQYQEQQDQITAGRLLSPVTQWYLFNPNNFRPFTNGGTIRLPFSGIARPGSIGGWLGKKIPWVRGFLDGSGHSTAREYATASMWWSPFGKQYKTTSGAEPYGVKTKTKTPKIKMSKEARAANKLATRWEGSYSKIEVVRVRNDPLRILAGTNRPFMEEAILETHGNYKGALRASRTAGTLGTHIDPFSRRTTVGIQNTLRGNLQQMHTLEKQGRLPNPKGATQAQYRRGVVNMGTVWINNGSKTSQVTRNIGKSVVERAKYAKNHPWRTLGSTLGKVGIGTSKVGWRGAVLGARVTSYALWGMLAWDIAKSIGQPLGRDLVTQAERANEKLKSINAWEFGGNLTAAYLSNGAATERQRAIQAISQSRFNGRAAMGSEAMYGHQGY